MRSVGGVGVGPGTWRGVRRAIVGGVAPRVGGRVVAEFVVIGATCRSLSRRWELVSRRERVGPCAGRGGPARSVAAVAAGALGLAGSAERLGTRGGWPSSAAAVGVAVRGVGVTGGRHFASLSVRPPCSLAFRGRCGATRRGATRRPAPRRGSRPPLARPRSRAGAALCWSVDARVLPRLYPAFHARVSSLTLLGGRLWWLARRSGRPRPARGRPALAFAAVSALVASACALVCRRARRGPRSRRQPALRARRARAAPRARGRARGSARARPSRSTTTDAALPTRRAGEVARALDWTGHDIVLVSVDALRADHVGATATRARRRPTSTRSRARARVFEPRTARRRTRRTRSRR